MCMIMDCEDLTVFTDAMELHYIDMKAFAKAVNESGSIDIGDTEEAMFAKWLSIITQKEIADKTIIEDACKGEEEIQMAVKTLAKQGEDKLIRQAYQRRQDEIYFYNKEKYDNKCKLEEKDRKLEEKDRKLEENKRKLEEKDATIADQERLITELKARLGEK